MTTTNSVILWSAFLAGPEVLALEDAVLADPEALADVHTALGAVEANLILEGESQWDASILRDQVLTLGQLSKSAQPDPRRVRATLQNILSGFDRISEDARARALAHTRRVMLFDNPAAMREAVGRTLGVGERPFAMSQRVYDNILEFLSRQEWARVQVPEALYGYALNQDGYPPDAPHPISVLIFHFGHGQDDATLHYLSLLVTHSPKIFGDGHIQAMEEAASKLRGIQADHLHALTQQLRTNR